MKRIIKARVGDAFNNQRKSEKIPAKRVISR